MQRVKAEAKERKEEEEKTAKDGPTRSQEGYKKMIEERTEQRCSQKANRFEKGEQRRRVAEAARTAKEEEEVEAAAAAEEARNTDEAEEKGSG